MSDNQKTTKENFSGDNIEERYDRSMRERFSQLKTQRTLQTLVGEPDDLIPFAWRHPLKIVDRKKVGKFLRNMVTAETERQQGQGQSPEEL